VDCPRVSLEKPKSAIFSCDPLCSSRLSSCGGSKEARVEGSETQGCPQDCGPSAALPACAPQQQTRCSAQRLVSPTASKLLSQPAMAGSGAPLFYSQWVAPKLDLLLVLTRLPRAMRHTSILVHLDVPVGDAQAVAVVHGHHELLEQRARRRLGQRLALEQEHATLSQLPASLALLDDAGGAA
jgi:hypothetical protein